MDVQAQQLTVFENLLRKGAGTAYAKHVRLTPNMRYDEFRACIPLSNYVDIEPWVNRIKTGHRDMLWPGVVRRFAVSAGTTGNGKHIPIYDDRLQSDLYFMRRVMRHVLRDNPDPGLFLGKHIALSGSIEVVAGIEYGEISGILASASPKWLRLWQTLCPEKSAYTPWSEKFEALIMNSMYSDIRVITGVPSWILILLREVSLRRGMPIEHIWPNLRLIITGGVALSGYIHALSIELGSLNVRFLENYGASEGYFALDWFDSGSMLLQYDSNIFYEFLPIDSTQHSTKLSVTASSNTIPLWEVESNVRYGLVVTNNSGLWRYITNDEVVFESINPPRIRVNGRLNEMTDSFGEAVTASDVRRVAEIVLAECDYQQIHIHPTWTGNPLLPTHEWIVVVSDPNVRTTIREKSLTLTHQLDRNMQLINRHYAIRRETSAMTMPHLRVIEMGEYEAMIRVMKRSQSKLGMFI